MVYRNYYARRGAQSIWRQPGSAWNTRRAGYGYRPGHAWNTQRFGYAHRPGAYGWQARQHYGSWPGYRPAGVPAGRYGLHYGSPHYPQHHGNWPWRSGYRYSPLAGAYAQQPGYAPPPQAQGAPPPEAAAPPQWIAWLQSCLSQAVGTWVPQNGTMGKATRHAIRKFQKQQQLPPTGMLDAATINALQAACSGQAQGAAPAPPPPPAAPAGDDVAAASAAAAGAGGPAPDAAPPDAGAPPPDGAAPPDGSGVAPSGASGELFLRRSRRRQHHRGRRRWGSGFNFNPAPPQPPDGNDDGDDDGELFWGEGGHFRHGGWGGGMNNRPFENDRSFRRRW